MMSFIVPLLDKSLRKLSQLSIFFIVFVLIVVQEFLVIGIHEINNKYCRFLLDETLLYAFGYLVFSIIGLHVNYLTRFTKLCMILATGIGILLFLLMNDWVFDPQQYKYPPHSLYLLYGVFACMVLWFIKPLIVPFLGSAVFRYLSTNSMWIYLWHILPVYAIQSLNISSDSWLGRYAFVLIIACSMNFVYQKAISYFPSKIRKAIK